MAGILWDPERGIKGAIGRGAVIIDSIEMMRILWPVSVPVEAALPGNESGFLA